MIKLYLPYAPSGRDLYKGWGKTRRLFPPARSGGTTPLLHRGLKQAIASPPLCLRRQNMRQHLTSARRRFSDAFSTTASSRATVSAMA
ncbi:hypothetical protein [Sinorhizobium meliloti]|uniref:hypothetical protein n=1 Tax=Rhizobium meliloti TaxID=382 RepID=UPI001F169211|nr:hypothetical protein [Sinorhizobium meliloti]